MAHVSRSADDNDNELVHQVAALERTALSWERTGIGVAAAGALLLHLRDESTGLLVLGGVLILTAIAIVLVLAPLRYRAARDDVLASESVVQQWALLSLSLIVAVVGVGFLIDLVVRSLI